jgi:hypothetical protein
MDLHGQCQSRAVCPPCTCRRLLQNPSYYDLRATDPESVSAFLSDMVARTLATLQVLP